MLRIGEEVFDIFYPVGSYYETSNANFNPNVNPNWHGKWIEDTKGQVLVALDSEQTEFNNVGKIGGSKFLAKHFHSIVRKWRGSGFSIPYSDNVSGWALGEGADAIINNTTETGTGNAGNLQPYIVVKRWHRIA